MANEFWNVLITAVASFIVGMAIHSALGHTWGDRLREIFHKDKKPRCFGKRMITANNTCTTCKHEVKCEEKCLTSTE